MTQWHAQCLIPRQVSDQMPGLKSLGFLDARHAQVIMGDVVHHGSLIRLSPGKSLLAVDDGCEPPLVNPGGCAPQ